MIRNTVLVVGILVVVCAGTYGVVVNHGSKHIEPAATPPGLLPTSMTTTFAPGDYDPKDQDPKVFEGSYELSFYDETDHHHPRSTGIDMEMKLEEAGTKYKLRTRIHGFFEYPMINNLSFGELVGGRLEFLADYGVGELKLKGRILSDGSVQGVFENGMKAVGTSEGNFRGKKQAHAYKQKPIPLLVGKSQDYVLEVLGEPGLTKKYAGSHEVYWYYPAFRETDSFLDITLRESNPTNERLTLLPERGSQERDKKETSPKTEREVTAVRFDDCGLTAREVLAEELLPRPKTKTVLVDRGGELVISWNLEGPDRLVEIYLQPTGDFRTNEEFDPKSGVYQPTYHVDKSLDDGWLDTRVKYYHQLLTNDPTILRLYTGGSMETLKLPGPGHKLVGQERSWFLVDTQSPR